MLLRIFTECGMPFFFSELCSVFCFFLSGRQGAPISNVQRWWEWPMCLIVIYLQIIGLNSFFNGDIIYNTKSLLTRFLAQVCSYRRIVPDLRTFYEYVVGRGSAEWKVFNFRCSHQCLYLKNFFFLVITTHLIVEVRMCNFTPCLNQLKQHNKLF